MNKDGKDGGGRGFMDRVFGFLGIEHEDAAAQEPEPQYVPPQARPEPSNPRRGRLVSLPGARRSPETERLSVVVQKPTSFEDVQGVADCLKERRPVILSVEAVPKEVARRMVDFVSGAAYALDGRMHRLGESLFLFTPSNVGIDVAEGTSSPDYDFDEEFDYPGNREV
ncbi:MAG TPA: cell division protein SepF [Limnochordales bacterium]